MRSDWVLFKFEYQQSILSTLRINFMAFWLSKKQLLSGSDWCVSPKQKPLRCQMRINTRWVKLNLSWHDMRVNKRKRRVDIFPYTVERDSCYLTPIIPKDKGSQIYECAYVRVNHVCACVCPCMSNALLIKLMDSGRSLLRPPVPSFFSFFALCSLPLKQSIHSSSKYLFLTSQEKSIMGRRGTGHRWKGEGKWRTIKGSRISGERKKGFVFLHCDA